MEPDLPTTRNNIPSQKQPKGQLWKLLLGIFIGLMFLLCIFLVLDHFQLISLKKIVPFKTPSFQSFFSPSSSTDGVIAKVGAENIYQQDLDTEMRYYPKGKTFDSASVRKILMKKLQKDSIILQAGEKEGIIKLDSSFFNSSAKDYQMRMTKVAEVQHSVAMRQDKITGSYISIWFYNNSKPTTMDQAAAKQIAYTKISEVYNLVTAKKLTMQQAGDRLKADTSLGQIDIAYKSNAIDDFSVGLADPITFDKGFDAQIKQLKPGEITAIYLAKDRNIKTRQMVDAMYMFAQVSSRGSTGNTSTFDDWFAKNEKQYAITNY